MTIQPRRPAGTRTADVSEGGRWASKPSAGLQRRRRRFSALRWVRSVTWATRTVEYWGMQTTFTRNVETTNGGGKVVTINSDCDDPTVLLLARKGDPQYWNGDTWANRHEDCLVWCVDIACRMLNEGLIATGYDSNDEAIAAAMSAASNPNRTQPYRFVVDEDRLAATHTLTETVAQIRGLRLLQSMAPTERWSTRLGAYDIPQQNTVVAVESRRRCRRGVPTVASPPLGKHNNTLGGAADSGARNQRPRRTHLCWRTR